MIYNVNKGYDTMMMYSVFDEEFKPYGSVVKGVEEIVSEILDVLVEMPLPEAVQYVAEQPELQKLPATHFISQNLYGGMPVQMGWCNGHNTKLNCLEYHRDSEFNVGMEDFILLVAKQHEIESGFLDTAKVKAFRVPAGVLVECYATTLHYAPCHANKEKGFKVLIALPKGTNTEKPDIEPKRFEDQLLWARNKWLIAHKDTSEAAEGAYIGLIGENIDIDKLL